MAKRGQSIFFIVQDMYNYQRTCRLIDLDRVSMIDVTGDGKLASPLGDKCTTSGTPAGHPDDPLRSAITLSRSPILSFHNFVLRSVPTVKS